MYNAVKIYCRKQTNRWIVQLTDVWKSRKLPLRNLKYWVLLKHRKKVHSVDKLFCNFIFKTSQKCSNQETNCSRVLSQDQYYSSILFIRKFKQNNSDNQHRVREPAKLFLISKSLWYGKGPAFAKFYSSTFQPFLSH